MKILKYEKNCTKKEQKEIVVAVLCTLGIAPQRQALIKVYVSNSTTSLAINYSLSLHGLIK